MNIVLRSLDEYRRPSQADWDAAAPVESGVDLEANAMVLVRIGGALYDGQVDRRNRKSVDVTYNLDGSVGGFRSRRVGLGDVRRPRG